MVWGELLVYLSFFNRLQIGVRYVLPLLPLLILFAVRPVTAIWELGRIGKGVLLAIGLWMIVTTTSQWPNFLSAFNAFGRLSVINPTLPRVSTRMVL